MIGIYSLTSPTRKVYIGQSWDIEKRITGYRTHLRCKQQVGISRSIEKYGFKQHVVKTLYELPPGITQNVLDEFEIFFINQYKCAGVLLLNMKDGGSGGKPNEETLLKIKEARARQTPPTIGLKFSEETKERMRNAQKDRRFPEWAIEKGRETRRLNGVSEATKRENKK